MFILFTVYFLSICFNPKYPQGSNSLTSNMETIKGFMLYISYRNNIYYRFIIKSVSYIMWNLLLFPILLLLNVMTLRMIVLV